MPGPRQIARPGAHTELLSAAIFQLEITGMSTVNFAELGAINMETTTGEYQAIGKKGIEHAKLFGAQKPPTVTLKRGLDKDLTIWTWYQMVRTGLETAYKTCTLKFFRPMDPYPGGPPGLQYILQNAWPSKMNIGSMKSGTSDLVMMELTLICDNIIDPNAKASF
ncbi:hypothetical protein Athai_47080 [Actinocatenispora thailandica]|uniref:Phage tail protein n=2 Tax=Actinocatenispora TaxID=390988 RepID=A0A810L8N7_9ACTN|nr:MULTISPECIES: phage tail protein [Actinocatenispora]BCJ31900.1 hypothetical protein Asera_60080 [Actinocatenispora sera]BCJ37205.1 hypothetical protein Athai_47080 [Actinocatenispora thailandica]